MQRVNSVSKVTRNSVNQDADQKENPAVRTAGLSNVSDQASLSDFTGEEFVAAIRVILQARSTVRNVIDYANMINGGRTFESFETNERNYIYTNLIEAQTIYREMHRGQVRVDFKKIIGRKKYDFEDAFLTVQRFFGGE